jgi:dTDP-4-dehydrorhamnose reductase
LYSEFGTNFCKTMLRLGKDRDKLQVVFDQIGTPTYAEDLASAIVQIITNITSGSQNFVPGIYHFSNEGVASWYDFALAIFELNKTECEVEPVTSEKFPTKAVRPSYSVLDKTKIKTTFGLTVPYWRDALKRCLSCYNEGIQD